MADEHLPHRPYWSCWTCGRPWPCSPAREQLAAELDMVQLPILMCGYLEDAVRELRGLSTEEYFDRFIAWTRPAPGPAG